MNLASGFKSAEILSRLPNNLDELADETGAIKRRRHLIGGDQLLWLALEFAGLPTSFRRLSAKLQRDCGLMLNDTSIRYRLKNSVLFLTEVLMHVLFGAARDLKAKGITRRICLQDATTLSGPGSKGTDWRLHTVYVVGQGFAQVHITDASVGESLKHCDYSPNDIVIADQGLGTAKNIHHVRKVGAHTLLRVYLKNLRLNDETGKVLQVDDLLNDADKGISSRNVLVPLGRDNVAGRLLIFPLPAEKAARNRQKLTARASRKQNKVTPQALRLAGYFAAFTTVSEQDLPDAQVVEVYRFRWQIELFFKRCKSIAGLDKLAARKPEVARAFILGKLIIMALVERASAVLEHELRSGTTPKELSLWRMTTLCYDDMITALRDVADRQERNEIAGLKAIGDRHRKRRCQILQMHAFNTMLNSTFPRNAEY